MQIAVVYITKNDVTGALAKAIVEGIEQETPAVLILEQKVGE